MRLGWYARVVLAMLLLDAVLLATVELFFLPLRLPYELGGRVVPLSIVLAAVSTPLLVRAAAQLAARMLVAAAPLGAWLTTIVVLGVAGPGGDVMLPGNVRSLLLVAAGVLPCGYVLGRLAASAVSDAVAGAVAGPVTVRER